MLLKRKRSDSELSFSSASTFSSPPRPDGALFVDGTSSFPSTNLFASHRRHRVDAHLNSRSMKRCRDNRPSEEEVHQRTLNMLFSAAQKPQSSQENLGGFPSQIQPVTSQQQHHPATAAQKSLHSFWKLPSSSGPSFFSSPSTVSAPPVDRRLYAPTNCEDCGGSLGANEAEGDDCSMDVDGLEADVETSCAACAKHVCSHCSISNLGEQRRCLNCAGRNVAGPARLGWTDGMTIC